MAILYRVTGRYMAGSEVSAYHLNGDDGSNLAVSKEKAILMISRGQIENMRVQYSGDDVIIRGKGTNLNTLPIFDIKKSNFRDGNSPEHGSSAKTTRQNPMAQYKITKVMMYKTSCVGYVIQDTSGRELRIPRDKAIDFALKGLFINAEASKYRDSSSGDIKVKLRGVGCELRNLDKVLVDQNGNIVDTTKKASSLDVRATKVRKAGIIYNHIKKTKDIFKPGDYLICTPTGAIAVMKNDIAIKSMARSEATTAMCDNYLENLSNFSIEFIGEARNRITGNQVSSWRVVTINRGIAS